jgi:hypothetical protein
MQIIAQFISSNRGYSLLFQTRPGSFPLSLTYTVGLQFCYGSYVIKFLRGNWRTHSTADSADLVQEFSLSPGNITVTGDRRALREFRSTKTSGMISSSKHIRASPAIRGTVNSNAGFPSPNLLPPAVGVETPFNQ